MANVKVTATHQEGTKIAVTYTGYKARRWTLTEEVDVTQWEMKHKKRSDIIHAIIHSHSTEHLQMIIDNGWDVNEVLKMNKFQYDSKSAAKSGAKFPFKVSNRKITALQEASKHVWRNGVRILLDAGADMNLCPEEADVLTLALSHSRTDDQVEVVRLILEHGAIPHSNKDQWHMSPLVVAITRSAHHGHDAQVVDLLLQHGADPNFPPEGSCFPLILIYEHLMYCLEQTDQSEAHNPLAVERSKVIQTNADFFRSLVNFGADVNLYAGGEGSLLHRLVFPYQSFNEFLPEHLSLFYQSAGDINRIYETEQDEGSALEHALKRKCTNVNNIRWLIRHGADTRGLQFSIFEKQFKPFSCEYNYLELFYDHANDAPLILLAAGMKVSKSLASCLCDLQEKIRIIESDVQTGRGFHFVEHIEEMFGRLRKEEANEFGKRVMRTEDGFSVNRTKQMADLREFSDQSLDVYPEGGNRDNANVNWDYHLKTISKILDHLTQPRTLQWWCRCCIRESLVSLAPSAVKTLPVPARLKRYILCHEL